MIGHASSPFEAVSSDGMVYFDIFKGLGEPSSIIPKGTVSADRLSVGLVGCLRVGEEHVWSFSDALRKPAFGGSGGIPRCLQLLGGTAVLFESFPEKGSFLGVLLFLALLGLCFFKPGSESMLRLPIASLSAEDRENTLFSDVFFFEELVLVRSFSVLLLASPLNIIPGLGDSGSKSSNLTDAVHASTLSCCSKVVDRMHVGCCVTAADDFAVILCRKTN